MAIVTFIDHSSASTATLRYAAWAAKLLNQPLRLVAMIDMGIADTSQAYEAYQGMDAREDLYREMVTSDRAVDPAAEQVALELVQAAARTARELGVQHVRTMTSPETLVYFIEHSTDSGDLLVFARHHQADTSIGRHLDEVLRVRKRVMLLTPETFAPPESWLMALDGGAASGRAVEYLIRNPLIRDAPGTAAIVGTDHQNRIHFRDAVRHLQSAGYRVTPYELQGGADDVLAAIMKVAPVDLLVMGAYGQGRFRSLFERSTTSRLLGTFNGLVLLARA